jgi:hypothetical protein
VRASTRRRVLAGAIAFVATAIALLALRRSGREARDGVSPRDGLRRVPRTLAAEKVGISEPGGVNIDICQASSRNTGLREREPAVHRGHRFGRRNAIVRGGAATRDPVRVRRF